jgi:hypothetical protein
MALLWAKVKDPTGTPCFISVPRMGENSAILCVQGDGIHWSTLRTGPRLPALALCKGHIKLWHGAGREERSRAQTMHFWTLRSVFSTFFTIQNLYLLKISSSILPLTLNISTLYQRFWDVFFFHVKYLTWLCSIPCLKKCLTLRSHAATRLEKVTNYFLQASLSLQIQDSSESSVVKRNVFFIFPPFSEHKKRK